MFLKKNLKAGLLATALILGPTGVAFAQDTDSDGVVDTDETDVLYTNPGEPSFGSFDPAVAPDYTDPRINGEYVGVLFDSVNGLVGKIVLKLDSKGKFSGTVSAPGIRNSLRGTLNETGDYDGSATQKPVMVLGRYFPVFSLEENSSQDPSTDSDDYVIRGTFKTVSRTEQYFELRRRRYSTNDEFYYQGPSTFISNRPNSQVPFNLGEGYGMVDFKADGSFKFRTYLPDGTAFSDAGYLTAGNVTPIDDDFFVNAFMPVFAYTGSSKKGITSFNGNYQFRTQPGISDFDGPNRMKRTSVPNNSLFGAGYDQVRITEGAFYFKPGFLSLPVPDLPVTTNNVTVDFVDGVVDSHKRPATWGTDGSIIAPFTQNFKLQLKANNNTGEFSGTYFVNDLLNGPVNTKVSVRGVAQQVQNRAVGFYINNFSTGTVGINENVNGTQPEITVVAPTRISAPQPGGVYQINVQTVGLWEVEVPLGVDWVNSSITVANGNATVQLTVEPNELGFDREGVIKVAGQKVRIRQEAFFNN